MWFAAYGLPEEVVSDNGPQLIASEFVDSLKQNGVKHTLVPPYHIHTYILYWLVPTGLFRVNHPSSNGAAERTVQILKQALQKEA